MNRPATQTKEVGQAAYRSDSLTSDDGVESANEKNVSYGFRWPLWKILAVAGTIAAVIIGLSVGLGVGLTRHKTVHKHKSNGSSHNDTDSGSDAPNSTSKLAVYWGVSGETMELDSVCSDSAYDIVNLAFLSRFFADGGYPRLSLSMLNGPSSAQKKAGATALQDATSLAPAIKKCQDNGKKVLLSMGGAKGYADVLLTGDTQAQEIAETVWNLFLGGTENPDIRPFGNITLDGLDFDNESGLSTGYVAMTKWFQSKFESDKKDYILTAAPQCPFPNDPEFFDMAQHLDYVWVQFYNNEICNVDNQAGFDASVKKWSKALGNTTFIVGALAAEHDVDTGYVNASTFNDALGRIKDMNLTNFGGAMLWEAQMAAKNDNYQRKIKTELDA